MSGRAAFRTLFPPFERFLDRQGALADDGRFVARNFLLDENVLGSRARSYGDYGARDGFASRTEWVDAHQDYLTQEVFAERPTNGPPGTLDPASLSRCPETFRRADNFVVYGKASKGLDLLRVLSARSLANRTGRPLQQILEAAGELVRARDARESPDKRQEASFKGVLGKWNKACDMRPSFATFYADHEDLFEVRSAGDVSGWPEELRDRLGLSDLDPGARGELPILVFRYAVSEVPKRKQTRLKPLAVPSILDGSMCPAFCPAPTGVGYGHTLHLAGAGPKPCREVVHPYLDLRPRHLFRVGLVRRPVPGDLLQARRAHILMLRTMSGRDDYATGTDPEV